MRSLDHWSNADLQTHWLRTTSRFIFPGRQLGGTLSISIDGHDSPLGQWLLARWEPRHLSGIVEGIWYFEGRLTHLRERHFSSGRMELVVQGIGDRKSKRYFRE
jgi:hypothetical protein